MTLYALMVVGNSYGNITMEGARVETQKWWQRWWQCSQPIWKWPHISSFVWFKLLYTIANWGLPSLLPNGQGECGHAYTLCVCVSFLFHFFSFLLCLSIAVAHIHFRSSVTFIVIPYPPYNMYNSHVLHCISSIPMLCVWHERAT